MKLPLDTQSDLPAMSLLLVSSLGHAAMAWQGSHCFDVIQGPGRNADGRAREHTTSLGIHNGHPRMGSRLGDLREKCKPGLGPFVQLALTAPVAIHLSMEVARRGARFSS